MTEAQVLMTPQTVTCPAHGEHFRARWPKGWTVFALMVFEAAVQSDALADAVREVDGLAADADVPPEGINRVTVKRPLCYFASREQIRDAMMECGIASIAQCRMCKLVGPGGPYSVAMPRHLTLPHVCFECALTGGEKVHARHPEGGVWT